jgi:putative transposase
LREECLRTNWFSNLCDARSKITDWRKEYNEVRPHSSLDYRTPNEFAQALRDGGMKNAYGVSHAAIPPSNT